MPLILCNKPFISAFNSRISIKNSLFENIILSNGAGLIACVNSPLLIDGANFINVIKEDNFNRRPPVLIAIEFSDTELWGCTFVNSTSAIQVVQSYLEVAYLSVTNIIPTSGVQFVIQSSDSEIDISDFNYYEISPSQVATADIGGTNSGISILQGSIVVRGHQSQPLVSFEQKSSVLVRQILFDYSEGSNSLSLLNFDQTGSVFVDSCTFMLTGDILSSTALQNFLSFTNNVVLTRKYTKGIDISIGTGAVPADAIFIINNYFIQQENIEDNTYIARASSSSSYIVLADSSLQTLISSNVFCSLRSQLSIIGLLSEKSLYNAVIFDNLFVNNEGCAGTGILLSVNKQWTGLSETVSHPQAIIDSCIFLFNKALLCEYTGFSSGRGGAIYQTSQSLTHQDTTIQNTSIFMNNSALYNGGAIYFDYSPLVIEDKVIFAANNAIQPNHIGSYPVRVVSLSFSDIADSVDTIYVPNQTPLVQKEPQKAALEWKNVPSRLPYQEQPCVFALLDMYNQLVFDDFSSLLHVSLDGSSGINPTLFYPSLDITASGGLYRYRNATFVFRLTEAINVIFISTAVKDADYLSTEVHQKSNASTIISMFFRDCRFGEYLIQSELLNKCMECQPGYWSTGKESQDNKQSCAECDQTSTLCLGGSKIGPLPGYWRMNSSSDIVMACDYPDACLGNDPNHNHQYISLDPTGQCNVIYKGNMCKKCVDGYGKIDSSECVDCTTSTIKYLKLVVLFAFQLGLMIYGIKEVVDKTEELYKHDEVVVKTNEVILLRIFVNYIQMISLISQEVPVHWSSAMKSALSINSELLVIRGVAISTDCLLRLGERITHIPQVFLETLLVVLTPVLLIGLCIIFLIIYFQSKGRRILYNKAFTNQITVAIVIICFNFQPNIIKSCLQLFQCINLYRIDTPVNFLSTDYDLQCWTPEHTFWIFTLAAPNLLLWGPGLIIFVYLILRRNSRRLDSVDFRNKYAFLYIGYKRDKRYWELFIIFRKLVLVFIVVFAGYHSTALQIYLFLVVLTVIYWAQKRNRPYSDEKLNQLEDISLFSAGLINFCALYFQVITRVPSLY